MRREAGVPAARRRGERSSRSDHRRQSGLNTGPPLLTRNGELTRLVEYPIQQFHALAVLRFVEGEPLDWGANGSLPIVGKTLGTIHRALLDEGSLELPDQLFSYLVKDDAWGHHPELQPLITRAIDAVRSFEARQRVTYGPIYGDGLQVRINPHDASVGVIDWGTVSFGPLVLIWPLRRKAHGEWGVGISRNCGLAISMLGLFGGKNSRDFPTTKR